MTSNTVSSVLSPNWLEHRQIPLYLLALLVGACIGLIFPSVGAGIEAFINPVLMLLLYATFLSIPLTRLGRVLRDGRFLGGLLVLNFVFVPIVVYALSRFVTDHPALLLGVLLVLLTPCIDYVIVFSGLAGAAHERLLAAAPLLMLAQMLLLPVYLGLFVGHEPFEVIDAQPFINALLFLIVTPLALAGVTQFLAARSRLAQGTIRLFDASMVPLVMVTLAVVVASQIDGVRAELDALLRVIPIYLAFLIIMVPLGMLTGRMFGQGPAATRATVFSGATRNSLVVLPLALALPDSFALVPVVVVTQTLIELVGMVLYVRFIPRMIPGQPDT